MSVITIKMSIFADTAFIIHRIGNKVQSLPYSLALYIRLQIIWVILNIAPVFCDAHIHVYVSLALKTYYVAVLCGTLSKWLSEWSLFSLTQKAIAPLHINYSEKKREEKNKQVTKSFRK